MYYQKGNIIWYLFFKWFYCLIGGNYIRIVLPGVWTYWQTELLRRFLGAQGHFNIILKIQVITTMLHVLWLFLFVSVFEFGYQGIALSSWFTYILNFTLCMLYITYNKSLFKEGSLHWINKDSFTGLWEYMRFGGPSLLLLLFDMWCFQIMMIMAGYLGPIEMGACLVIINFAAIIFVLILGISMSTSKLVGNSLGANDPERARKYRDMALVYAILFSTIIIIFMLIFKNNLPYLMTDHQEIAEKVTEIIPIMVCWITADSLQGISAGIIRSMGIQIYATVFCLSINWGIILPLAYVFAFPLEMKAFGVWLSTPIGTILIAISYIWLIPKISKIYKNFYTNYINYNIRRCLVPLNYQHFTKFLRGTRQRWFYFFLIFQNFLKFYNFFIKSSTGGLFYYYGIIFK